VPAGSAAVRVAAVAARPLATPTQTVTTLAFAVERFLDGVGQWLAGLPGGPLTELLSGGLWLIRRTLFPVGDGVGQWGTAACVATKDCSGQNLTGADLARQNLTEVNFTGATLRQANLTAATLINANLESADLYQANLTDADLTGAQLRDASLRSVTLRGANLTGTDLSKRKIATDIGIDLTGVNLTGAKLYKTNLSDVTLTGANLTNVDLTSTTFNTRTRLSGTNFTGANLSGKNLSGYDLTGTTLTNTNLAGANLAGADFTDADLTGADFSNADLELTNLTAANATKVNFTKARLIDAMLAKTDLSGANLSGAVLTGANLITATLTNVAWDDTACPRGGTSSTGCSPFASHPEGNEFSSSGASWYQYRSPGTPTLPSSALLGTSDTPLAWEGSQNRDDGIQGNITNLTGQRILVRSVQNETGGSVQNDNGRQPAPTSRLGSTRSSKLGDFSLPNEAILEPNAVMPYRLAPGGSLYFFKAPEGQAVGLAPQLYIVDKLSSLPVTKFYPPGSTNPANVRADWKTEESHEEIWGSINLWVKRELDGWKIPASQEYIKRYDDPNTSETSDWMIFTIEVRSL
jgi:uncharacterized protein YjbI with pentapeptide repeats